MPLTTEESNHAADLDSNTPVAQDGPRDNEKIDGTGNTSPDSVQGLPGGQTSADDVVIAVMGSTGTGKSSFIKLLSGDTSIVVGDSLESETSDVQVIHFVDPATGRHVTIVDTPGFDDSRDGVTDTDILKKIAKFLVDCYDENRKLNGFIYLQRISDNRFGGQSARNLRMVQNLCGPDAFKNVIVLTTFWDKVTDEIGAKREKELKEKFLKQLAGGGARFVRHGLTLRSAQDVLRLILPLVPTHTLIGKEMVDDGKNLDQTAAGSVHSKEVEAIIAKNKKDMADLTAEIVDIRKTNEALAQELETERAELKEKLAKLENERLKLEKGLEDGKNAWENERSKLKKGIDDGKNAVEQLKADAGAEKERHEKWRQERERDWTVRLDSQARMHDIVLEGVQHQLEQEREEAHKRVQRVEGSMRRVEEKAENDRKEKERELTVRLDSQARMHRVALEGVQHQLEQEREGASKRMKRMEESMKRVEEQAEKDRNMLEELEQQFIDPLPQGWEECYANNGRPYFMDHYNQTWTWLDPRSS